jgi:hypothetical protein
MQQSLPQVFKTDAGLRTIQPEAPPCAHATWFSNGVPNSKRAGMRDQVCATLSLTS